MIKNKMLQDYRKIVLTGKVYIKYCDEAATLRKGDLRLFLHNDTIATFTGDYENSSYSGYLKAEVYDGKHWQMIDMDEFFENREYKYGKRQKPFDTAILCREVLSRFQGEEIHRTYRGHFTRNEYIPEIRVTKASSKRKV